MSDVESSNERESPRSYRIPGLKGFLPLSSEENNAMSTRGQALPGLISARKNSGTDKRSYRRRPSSFSDDNGRNSNDGRERGSPDDVESGLRRGSSFTPMWGDSDSEYMEDSRARLLMTPQMRSMRLIGYSNPRYRWEQYYKPEEELKKMKKPIRAYYERCNHLIQHYLYIDRLLDSSLPHNLIQEYHHAQAVKDWYKGGAHAPDVPATITEADTEETTPNGSPPGEGFSGNKPTHRVIRTKDIYRVKPNDENTPLLSAESIQDEEDESPESSTQIMPPDFEPDEEADSGSRIVTIAIYVNLIANTVLLLLKIVVVALSSSVSVLASLVDAALDFLSTAIVWVTTYLISRHDQYAYPIGRRRLEPVGILVFSVIMVTSFFQVALEGFQRLTGPDHAIVQLTVPAIAIMTATVVIKFACWLWCRLIPNSSVQALAQDAMTDVVFNTFSIIFPLVGYYAGIWWLDSLGGVLLSCYVIINWSQTSSEHIRNLTGAAATADERNILLYLTMRFAKTIKAIQGLQAYHSGDKLNVEVDIVLDEGTSLRDSHDLGESLQYVIESVPNVDRAFVHLDYAGWNLPSHMRQD